ERAAAETAALPPAMSPPRTCLEPGRRVRSARCVTADTHRTSFARVAHCYDETRALPAEVMAAVVARIAGELGPITSSPLLLEVGVGTGRIAAPLADAGGGGAGAHTC